MRRMGDVWLRASVVFLVACGAGREVAPTQPAALAQVAIGWGDGAGQLALRGGVAEAQTHGPSAIAVDPNGRVLVLDRFHQRVVALGARTVPVAKVAEDAELLAVADDGALATYSPLRGKVEIVDAAGAPLGTIDVPRALGPIRSVALGPSRRVSVSSPLQERFELGSPRFPLPLEVSLAGKREGAVALPEQRGAAIRVDKGQARLLLTAVGDRAPMRELTISVEGGRVDAAQLVGADGDVACLRTESLAHADVAGAPIEVARRVVCVDTRTGATKVDEALPAPGLYAPRAELAVGHGEVVHLAPGASGAVVTRFAFGGGAK